MLDYRDYPELSADFIARHPLDDPRFEPWLEAWYGAPVSDEFFLNGPDQTEIADVDRDTASVFVARSWLTGSALIDRFGADQVGQGVWGLSSEFNWSITPESGERLMWSAVETLFRQVFEPHAFDVLCHLSERGTKLGDALYMFWDVAGWMPWRSSDVGRQSFLTMIEYGLNSAKAAMQESALHGAGEYTPWNCEGTGDVPEAAQLARRFIAHGRTSRPELFAYAENAACGMVL